ncbi:hypothetical protein K493DRAFT_385503 [Basidiobolus meristosporus CBS 931.73]|uniref:Uncharacterized protein n=1 Tax=Basidiobolus meristosporus CBS 931.73 TaxID=1314790 RepID=A0A1Y1XQY7_9FUNG|nr:hypothetical protein K493DRAFT_385503 [Basidiobolus meristosporus CBS 931.73]|eukprot:ORX88147.1 hypothetical protein K493DRAFT_385503 [Basidiobolus meristosporus CBS 931.73]
MSNRTLLSLFRPLHYLRSSWTLTREILVTFYIKVFIFLGLGSFDGVRNFSSTHTVQYERLFLNRESSWEPGLRSVEASPLLNRRSYLYDTFFEDSAITDREHITINIEESKKSTISLPTANTWIQLFYEIFGDRYSPLKGHHQPSYMEKYPSRHIFRPGLRPEIFRTSALPPPTRVVTTNPNLLMT